MVLQRKCIELNEAYNSNCIPLNHLALNDKASRLKQSSFQIIA